MSRSRLRAPTALAARDPPGGLTGRLPAASAATSASAVPAARRLPADRYASSSRSFRSSASRVNGLAKNAVFPAGPPTRPNTSPSL